MFVLTNLRGENGILVPDKNINYRALISEKQSSKKKDNNNFNN